ncbi:MAG: flavodoxin family protein [Methanomassiliicoccales archaeon]|jgi:flavodoxin
MKALVAYYTRYGNTAKIAQAIATGMKEAGLVDVTVKEVASVGVEDFKSADIWIIGSPTHFWSAVGEIKKALKAALAAGPQGKAGAAFDTRYKGPTKGAANKIEETLSEAGVKIVVPCEFYLVMKGDGPLADGEEARAQAFGRKIAAAVAH